jgi:hypothetical protein
MQMSKRDDLVEYTGDDDLLFLDEEYFDAAIIGVTERCGQVSTVCYDTGKIIEILMENGMSDEEAWEYYNFNIAGAWVGDRTPTFVDTNNIYD